MSSSDYDHRRNKEWLGYLQPMGLVVSPPALSEALAFPNASIIPEHNRFLECVGDVSIAGKDEKVQAITDFPRFCSHVLGWRASDLVGSKEGGALPETLESVLTEYHETLRPTYAVKHPESKSQSQSPWMLLVKVLPNGTPFDDFVESDSHHWQVSSQARFERLLRDPHISMPIGLLFNGTSLRLVYAPKGESSGHLTFPVRAMTEVAGRPIFAALVMLLGEDRLFTLPDGQRLQEILEKSRKYQNLVSTKLAEQVLAALYELLRGFQGADDQRKGELLRQVLQDDPNQVYAGLLTVLLRLVFLLYAEDRGLMSDAQDELYQNYYAVTGLFERLRADAGRHTDTMDRRFGAWAQLLALFRMVHDGGRHDRFAIPARKGYLFNPDKYPFLEGRAPGQTSFPSISDEDAKQPSRTRRVRVTVDPPHVSDGVIFRVLQNLLILDGERLSYRTLDVEQIGSVYETIMGFILEVAQGRSIAIKPTKPHGAPTTINLEELLSVKPADRAKWLKEQTDQSLTGQAATALKTATTIEELLAALEKKIAKLVTPSVVSRGAIVLQPSDERRRSGSHYTPRSLTEPIVRTALRPILERLIQARSASECVSESTRESVGERATPIQARSASECVSEIKSTTESTIKSTSGKSLPGTHSLALRARMGTRTINQVLEPDTLDRDTHSLALRARMGTPTPDQILDLKVCDPAMGSGAFLVEACRQLGDELVKAWHAHDAVPKDIPPDEDEILHARRLIAQRCLYGVDKNPMAVDLAKLSLWLATLAKDHPFTFLDHALRDGDSLVGLTKAQILGFHWKPDKQRDFARSVIEGQLNRALEQRRQIREAPEGTADALLRERLLAADGFINPARRYGNLVVSAFFAADKDRKRKDRLEILAADLAAQRSQFDVDRHDRLDAAVRELRGGTHPIHPFHWEIEFPEVFDRENPGFDAFVGNPPFFKGSFISGTLGEAYRDWLLSLHDKSHGNADLVAHFFRRTFDLIRSRAAFGLLATNTIGQGDTRSTGLKWICDHGGVIVNAIRRLKWPGQAAVVVSVVHVWKGNAHAQQFLDGRLVGSLSAYLINTPMNADPARLRSNQNKAFQGPYVYGMGFTFDDTDKKGVATPLARMDELISRDQRNAERIFPFISGEEINESPTHSHHRYVISFGQMDEQESRQWPDLMEIVETKVKPERIKQKRDARKKFWWQFGETTPALFQAIRPLKRMIVQSFLCNYTQFTFVPSSTVVAAPTPVFAFENCSGFAVLQSRPHEVWARMFSSSMKDDLRYSLTDCFETFPFPKNLGTDPTLESAGQGYHEFRAALMIRNNEGLTKTYNRFHDPDERSPDILKLRELHAAMDRAVLDAYDWTDLKPTCEFLLDYEEDEDEDESGAGRRRKKPWRYRWPDDFRDEVLARLLELNKQRAEQERLTGAAAESANTSPKRKRVSPKPKSTKQAKNQPDPQQTLFDE